MEIFYESSHEVKIKFTHRQWQHGIHRKQGGEYDVYRLNQSIVASADIVGQSRGLS